MAFAYRNGWMLENVLSKYVN